MSEASPVTEEVTVTMTFRCRIAPEEGWTAPPWQKIVEGAAVIASFALNVHDHSIAVDVDVESKKGWDQA